ncbi:putative tail protein [Cellulophaga phage phi13:1]|uniref:Putative tail protein n=1 Tax=Cellulophaga phage phi13:1 TaxID=1327992 RepID=S0A103_9CAUD|nr:putative tail protein [Cellulophaga phage phi13:1]
MNLNDKKQKADNQTNQDPTDNQKLAGNYKKGKITINGISISIENPKDSIRSGYDSDGKYWESSMKYSYGYINGTIGKDGDPLDVFLSDNLDSNLDIFVIDQVDQKTRSFDEHKIMIGFENEEKAKQAYLDCYEKDWKGFGDISKFSLSKFKSWIKNKDWIKYPASKMSLSNKVDYKNVGDRSKIIKMFGEVLEGETLSKLKTQAGDPDSYDELIIEIASQGGSVSEGLEIMVWLDSLSRSGKYIVTVVVANAYSIASLIMLVADLRLISKHGKVMVHNPMLPELQYANANQLEIHVASLRELEAMMYELYQIFTNLSKENIKLLMDNETYLSPQDCVDQGFADMVVDVKPKPFEMALQIKNEINMSNTLNVLKRVIGMVNQSAFINQVYYDQIGEEIEIFQQDPATYKVGDRTSLEKSGEDGVKLSDGSILTIEDFKITDINRSITEDEKEATFNEGSAPKAEEEIPNQEPKVEEVIEEKSKDAMPSKVIETTESTVSTKETVAAKISRINKWEDEVEQDTFEIGTKVTYIPTELDPGIGSIGAGEWELEDGRKILTDSDGIIQFIKPKPETDINNVEVEEEQMKVDEEMKVDEKMKADDSLEMIEKEKYDAVVSKLDELQNKFIQLEEKTEAKFSQIQKFEDSAAETIELLANSTSTNFRPESRAIAKVDENVGKSIFQRSRKQVGL